MKLLKYSVFIFFNCLICTNLQAQEQTQSIDEGSISDQFEFVINKSNNFNENGQSYRVIKSNLLLTLKTHTLDSLYVLQAKLESTKKNVNTQQKELDTLKANLTKIQDTLSSIDKEKDSMSLFGMLISKTSYSLLMWSIIITLFIVLLFFIYKFKNSNVVTRTTKNAFVELENEFNEHKSKAIEREQKVMRQLQDEINKNKS